MLFRSSCDALWQVERASRRPGSLLDVLETTPDEMEAGLRGDLGGKNANRDLPVPVSLGGGRQAGIGAPRQSPLLPMTDEERLVADYRGTGLTVGPHPMAYRRPELTKRGICAAIDLAKIPDGTPVCVAGAVIARQRPGTAKGFVFLSLEDETGIANAIITPQLFAQDHSVVVHHQFLLIEGVLQNQDNVISVKAQRVEPLPISQAETPSHDFH